MGNLHCFQKTQETDMTGLLQCDDLMQFQRYFTKPFETSTVIFLRALKQLRAIDDKIIYALNVSTPTVSMQVGRA